MTIKIQTQSPSIPIEIGKLKFEFDTSDESIQKFRKNGQAIMEELETANVKDDDLDAVKDVLRRGYDLMLGEGAFDKIYKQTPSITLVAGYFMQLGEAIAEKIGEMGVSETQREKAEKYLKAKKKK